MSGMGESQQQNQPLDDSAPLEGHTQVPENPPVVMLPMKFNIHGLPVGPDSGKPAVKLGGLSRSQIPIKYKTWPEVPQPRKEAVWEDMKKVYNFSDEQKKAQLKKAGAAWRKYKGSLRTKYLKGGDVQRWIEAIPTKKARPEDWHNFCLNEATPEQLALRARNQKIKKDCARKSTHNTGRFGYARAEQNFKDVNNGRNPLRVELWLYTHQKKGGGFAPHDIEFARKLQGLLEIMVAEKGVETLDSGPLFDTFGMNKRGSLLCVGSCISRQALLASSFARKMLEEVDLDRVEWRNEVKQLREDNKKHILEMKELVEGLRNGLYNSNANYHASPNANRTSSSNASEHPSPNPRQGGTSVDVGYTSRSFRSLPCKVLSHTGLIVAYGVKSPPSAIVNNHVMKPTEGKVLIDEILDYEYPVWGGEQAGAMKLGDVRLGTFLYWLDDLLPVE